MPQLWVKVPYYVMKLATQEITPAIRVKGADWARVQEETDVADAAQYSLLLHSAWKGKVEAALFQTQSISEFEGWRHKYTELADRCR